MGKFLDLTGTRFGRLTVVKEAGRTKQGSVKWLCKCDCGNTITVDGSHLRTGSTRSCGCLQFEQRQAMGKANKGKGYDLTGQRFGRWLVLNKTKEAVNRTAVYECRCDCGTVKKVKGTCLTAGESTSCGCRKAEVARERSTKHGFSKHPLYHVLADMIQRCHNSNDKGFAGYGARGIYVCDEWQNNKAAFVEWGLKNGYKPGLQIDRIDNDRGYNPDNCRFVTPIENSNNKRNTVKTVFHGKLMSCFEIAKKYGVRQDLIRNRIRKGFKNDDLIQGGFKNGNC